MSDETRSPWLYLNDSGFYEDLETRLEWACDDGTESRWDIEGAEAIRFVKTSSKRSDTMEISLGDGCYWNRAVGLDGVMISRALCDPFAEWVRGKAYGGSHQFGVEMYTDRDSDVTRIMRASRRVEE